MLVFNDHLRISGYPVKAINASFHAIKANPDAILDRYSACALQIKTCWEQTVYWLASNSSWTSCWKTTLIGTSSCHAPSLQFSALLWWDLFCNGEMLAVWIGQLYCCPKIVRMPVPCCAPSAVNCQSDARWALFKLSHARAWIHTVGRQYLHKQLVLLAKTGKRSESEASWDAIGPTLSPTAASDISIQIGKFFLGSPRKKVVLFTVTITVFSW